MNNTTALNWMQISVLALASVIFLLVLYYPTTASMVDIWIRSETFAHGFLIFPIAFWLIWQRRDDVISKSPNPILWPQFILFLLSLLWLLAYLVDVLVIQQLALVSMIPFLVLSLLGWQATREISFALFFLLFAVPMGEGLVPSMIEFTADFTVAMVKFVGIPIFREGTYFELPTGNWSVVEACSGVRYLIASITLGFLYAYLTYRTLWKRVLFVLVSILVPVIANGLRAFMIVMIGHYSDMQLATGVDHLIYGWLFFGVVIAIMFYIGSFWREDLDQKKAAEHKQHSLDTIKVPRKQVLYALVLAVVSVGIAPLFAYSESQVSKGTLSISLKSPVPVGWHAAGGQSEWRPTYLGVDAEIDQVYQQEEKSLFLYVGYYVQQRQGAELITSTNLLVPAEEKNWRVVDKGRVTFGNNEVRVSEVKSPTVRLIVAHYFIVDGEITINDYIAKLREAKTRIVGGDKTASIVTIAMPMSEHFEDSYNALQMELESIHGAVMTSLKSANLK
ncbi:MAG: exosortase A [Gammaproteobacteria bacterium]|nr:exosortase A [Gammaproteobacteria bacterium]